MESYLEALPYKWPHDKSLSPATTALLIIDMQRDFLEDGGYLTTQGYEFQPLRRIIPSVLLLAKLLSESQFPVYFTRESHRPDLSSLSSREHFRSRNNGSGLGIGSRTPQLGRALVRGEPGCAIIPELAQYCHDDETSSNVFDKPGRSAFAHTDLELVLRNRGIKNIMICGVTTDVCVHSTMREANDRGFDCVLIQDACAAGTEDLHKWAVDSIQGEGGIFGTVTTSKDISDALGRSI